MAGVSIKRNGPRVEVIPLGVDVGEFFPRDRSEARRLLRLPEDGIVLLVVGRLSEEHKADLEPLLIVVRELARKTPNLTICFAGHDPDFSRAPEVENLAVRLGIRQHLRLILNFQDFLKPYIYSAADIFIAPSDNIQETFGIALVEAMACGLPVVASDWSGYRDLVVHNRTGFLVRTSWNRSAAQQTSRHNQFLNDDARRHMLAQQTVVDLSELFGYIEALITNPEMRRAFGEQAIQRVEAEFSWLKVIRSHEALWADLWATAESNPISRTVVVEDFDAVFGPFATAELNLDDIVARSPLRADMENALRDRAPKPGYDLIDPAEVQRIAERTLNDPVPIRRLIEEGTVRGTFAIAWLLKKGYLTTLRPSVAQGRSTEID